MTYINEVTKKAWPRWAVSPEGNRAIFHCAGDVPRKWKLETPLADAPAAPAQDGVVAELMRQLEELKAKVATKGKAAA